MKTRIISGAVIVVLSVLVLGASLHFPFVITLASGILAAIAVYEVLYATGIVKNKLITAVGMVFAVFFVLTPLLSNLLPTEFLKAVNITDSALIITVFALVQFALYLKNHKDIELSGMFGMIFLPIIIGYSFLGLENLVIKGEKLFYIILVLCWSAVADTGAYFVGVAIGKHKMAPVISPKKSFEGLVGGMVSSVVVVFLVCLLYSKVFFVKVNTPVILIITPIFVLIGVMGDLTASLIKRKCAVKDFGKLIPGHGGVLDRFDSILMISAALSTLMPYLSLIK